MAGGAVAGTPLAEAFVRVRALTDKFKDDVERGLAGLGDDFGKQWTKDVAARLRAERAAYEAVGKELGDAAGVAAGDRFGRRMAEEGAVRLDDDGNEFVKVSRDIGDDAGAAAGKQFAGRFWKDANGRWRDQRGRFVAEATVLGQDVGKAFNDGVDKSQSDAQGRGRRWGMRWAAGFIDGLGDALIRVGDLGRRALEAMLPSLGRLASGFGSAASAAGGLLATAGKWGSLAAGISAVGAAAAAAAGYTVELAAALAPLSGLLAGLPGVALTGAAAFTTWRLATAGLGKALSEALAGDYEAFSEAIVDMTDAGKAFALEFWRVAGSLRDFQAAVQGAFLAELSGRLAEWASAIGALQPAVSSLAAEFGALLRTALDFATAERTIGQFNVILGGTRDLIAALRQSLAPLLRGFVDLGVVGNQWLASFAPALRDSLATFGEWMSEISRSGQALAWLEDATKVLRQLGRLVKDVWQTFTGLLDAAEKAGDSALGVLGQLVSAMNKWVNSAEGQDILVEIFKALHDIGEATIPVIKALASAVGLIAPQIAVIAQTALPILAAAIDALGPAIAAIGPGVAAMVSGIGAAVQGVVPALLPLGQAIGAAFATLRPLIAAIGPAIAALLPGVQAFFQAAAMGAASLAPALAPIGAAFGSILAALSPLLPAIGQLAALIATSLAAGVQSILPSLQLLVSSFVQALHALSPVVPMVLSLAASLINSLVPALAPLLPQIASLVTQLVGGLVPALAPLIPIIGEIVGVIGQAFVGVLGELIVVVLQLLPPLSEAAVIIGQALLQALQQLLPHLPTLIGAFLSTLPALVALLPPFTDLATSLLPRMIDALVQILPHLPPLIRAMIDLNQVMLPLIPIFTDLLKRIAPYIPLFIELAAVIATQLIPPLTRFLVVVSETVGGVIREFTQLYNDLVGHSIIPDLINKIGEWVGKLPGMFIKWVGEAKDWAIRKFEELLGWVRGLPGQLVSALSGLGAQMGTIGHNMIIGIWNGMVGMWNWFRDSIYNFFAGIMPQWVKDALGIASPSKLFASIGKELPAGLAIGMDVGTPMVKAAAERMADATVGTFTEPSPASAFAGAFPVGHPALPVAAPAGGRVVNVENIHVQGVFDPSSPVSYRRMVERLREAIIELEQEEYAHG